jgi:hypothetical protein
VDVHQKGRGVGIPEFIAKREKRHVLQWGDSLLTPIPKVSLPTLTAKLNYLKRAEQRKGQEKKFAVSSLPNPTRPNQRKEQEEYVQVSHNTLHHTSHIQANNLQTKHDSSGVLGL